MEKNFSGKTVTAILALASAGVLFLFSVIGVAQGIATMIRGGTSAVRIVSFVLDLLSLLFSVAAVFLNALSLRKPQDERVFGLVTVIVSAVSAFVLFLICLIYPLVRGYFDFPTLSFVRLFLLVALLIAYIVCNAKFSRAPLAQTQNEATEDDPEPTLLSDSTQPEDGYLSFPLHVMCMLFFGFVWEFIWIYKVTKFLNAKTKFNRDTTVTLLLAIFVPFYTIYWTYKAAQEIDGLRQEETSGIAAICLVLCFVFPVAPPLLMQWKINKYSEKDTPKETRAKSVDSITVAEDLKRYKELLDEGAITQDDYDKIKSRYLSDQ